MSNNLEVGVKITADGKSLVGEARASKDALNQLGDSTRRVSNESAALTSQTTAQTASLASMKTGLIAAAGAYVSLSAAMAGGKALIETALANERLANTLTVATGSMEAAARETAFLRTESEKLGLQFTATSTQYAKLVAAAKGTTLEGQATRDIFLAMAKAATVLGMSAADTGGALLAIQQMISKGKVNAEELRGQLGERLPGAFQMAARAIGVTTAELDKMLEQGQLTAERLLPALAQELENTFGAQAQTAAQGLQAKINRLENSFTDLKTTIGNTGLIDLLSDGIVLATRFVDALSGAKVLSAVDAQKQKIIEMREELESLANRKHIPLIGDLLFDKKQADLLSQRIDDGIQDLKKLEQAAQEAADAVSGKKAITPGAKPELPKEWADELKKAEKERKKEIEDSEKTVAALKRETAEIGLNVIQRKMLAASIDAAKAPTEALRKQIMAEAAAYGQLALQQEKVAANKKFIEEQSKALADLGNSQTKQLRQQLEDARAQNALIGKTREEIIAMAGAKERETAAVIRNAAVYAGDMHDAYMRYANDLETTADLQQQLMQEKEVQRFAQTWDQAWSSMEQTGKNAFTQFAAHGKSALGSIKESLKLSVIDLLYQVTARPWIIQLGASLQSSFVGAAGANAATSGMSALNVASLASNGLGLLKSGFGATSLIGNGLTKLGGFVGSPGLSAFGGGFAGDAIGGLAAGGFSSGAASAASLGASVASFAGPALIAFAATQGLKMLAGDKRLGGGFGNVMNKIGDIPILGDMMPIIPLINALFGRGPLKQKETQLTGDVGAEGLLSGYLTANFKAKGGLLVGSKRDFAGVNLLTGAAETDNGKLQGVADGMVKYAMQLAQQINQSVGVVNTSLRDLSGTLGLSTKPLDDFKHKINLVSESGKALSEDQIAGEIAAISDEMVKSLLPTVDQFAKSGETSIQTISRLGAEFNALVSGAELLLGKSSADAKELVSGSTYQGRTAFVDAAGGLDALNQKVAFFADNFLNDAQRLAPVQEKLNAELNRLGLSSTLTRDQFRDLVQSFGKVNGISEDTLRALLNIQGAFVTVRNAADAAANKIATEKYGLETRLLQLQGNTVELRRRELELIDPSNQGLQKRIWAIEDENAAVAASSTAQQKVIEIAKKSLADDYNAKLKDVNLSIENIAKSVEELKDLSDLLKSTVSQIRPMSRDAAKQQIQDAIAAARSGGALPDAGSLREALGALGKSAPGFSGSFDYAREQAKTASMIETLGKIADDRLALDNRSMSALVAKRDRMAADFEKKTKELDNLLPNNNVPQFAKGGFHRGGLRIVGENGPELESTGPSRITSNNDLTKLLSNEDVVEKLALLLKELQNNSEINGRVANKLDAVTQGGTALRMKQIA